MFTRHEDRMSGCGEQTDKQADKQAGGAWSVYMVRCRDGSLYTVIAKDVQARLAAHNAGRGARYTRARLPVRLVAMEAGFAHGAALRREYALKRLSRARKLEHVAQHAAA